ncbi:ADP-ribosyltransferase [Bacillus cereus group sp. BfR-BA-01347]|uniref:ADP-ribosyltransferase n=1 Tax=Bacillus cereus group sp. BfR-BA-01347 TaxID=2920310 RepID=UPI001F568702|nr:ADP-ribosyltransferase [Bacillus cereus group sp. BfR-BA-01347]
MVSKKIQLVTKTLLFSTVLSLLLFNNEEIKAEQLNINFQGKYTNFQNLKITDKAEDFKEDKEKAKEWGKEKEKEWKLTATEKGKMNDFLSDKNKIKTNYKEITFSMAGSFEDEMKDLKEIDKIFDKANLSSSIITYKNVQPAAIGYNKSLTEGSAITDTALGQFKEQFLNKEIKFDSYLDTHLTAQQISSKERVILKVIVPSGKGSTTPTKAGVILNNNEYKMLIDNGYVLHVDKVSRVTQKGFQCMQVEGTLKKSLDLKNDINAEAHSWGMKNYEDWAENLTDSQREALDGYARQDYKEINNYLRNQGGSGNEKLDAQIKNISEALGKKPIPENITVYRWCGMPEFGYQIIDPLPSLKDFEEKFLNTIKEDKGYMSTSLSSERLAVFGSRKIILRLQVPKGSTGAYLSAIGGFASEKEILLDKDSKYHIDKVTEVVIKGVKRYVVDATLLPN